MIEENKIWEWVIGVATSIVGAYSSWLHGQIRELRNRDEAHSQEYYQLRLDLSERYVKKEEFKNISEKIDRIYKTINDLRIDMTGKADK